MTGGTIVWEGDGMTIEFKEPPRPVVRTGRAEVVRSALRELADAPGQWALVVESVNFSEVERIKARAHDIGLHVEVRTSGSDGKNRSDIYVRVLEKAPWFDNGASS